jgi:hypothetical protein
MRDIEAARVRLAAKQAEKIRQALRQTYNPQAIAADFFATFGLSSVTPEQARDWLRSQVRPNSTPLMDALPRIYAYAWALGQRVALAQIARVTGLRKLNKADKQPTFEQFIQALATDWSTWTPGTEAAGLLLKPPGALREVLDSRNKVIKDLNNTTLDRIGTQLSRGLTQGWTQDAVARSLTELLDDPQRAMTIASTEMSRATNIASRERYAESQIGSVMWVVAWGEACDLCDENADQGVTPLDEPFASGDLEPPAHPNCLCTLIPVVELADLELASNPHKPSVEQVIGK